MRAGRALLIFLVIGMVLVLVEPGFIAGQAHYPYRLRAKGEYFEGVWDERPISGVDLELKSVSTVVSDEDDLDADEDPGYLHLAFVLPEEFESIDIEIQGPGHYLLNEVRREFKPGFNVFHWDSKVVDGLGIAPDELEPLVTLVGDMYVPCFLSREKPLEMPEIKAYRLLLEANTEGDLSYFVRDMGEQIVREERPVSPLTPVEVLIPAGTTSHHMDLYMVLEYDLDGVARTIRQCFPIQSLHSHAPGQGER
jgi:hypothetical protein